MNQLLTLLKSFSKIRHLDLFENPAAEEANYRLRVVLALPGLQVFDRHSITYIETQKAKEYGARVR